jgi:hypothetical protein
MAKIALILVGLSFLAGALFVASTPWRVHGGRFVTEYLLELARGIWTAWISGFSA